VEVELFVLYKMSAGCRFTSSCRRAFVVCSCPTERLTV